DQFYSPGRRSVRGFFCPADPTAFVGRTSPGTACQWRCDSVLEMRIGVLFIAALLAAHGAVAADAWMGAWVGSAHGPYPAGNAVAQPDLRLVFPGREANEQTFRLIVKPDVWGRSARLRFTNVFGSQPVTFDGVFVGLHQSAG